MYNFILTIQLHSNSHSKTLYIYLSYMYPILEYSSTYLILEYYAYFHTNTLYIYPVFFGPIYMYILTASVCTILMHADSLNTLLIA